MVPWNGGGIPPPQPSQPAADSSFAHNNKKAPTNDSNKATTENDDFFTADDGVQSVDSYSTASLDPGSTFPQQTHLLRQNSLQKSSFSLRNNGRAITNPHGNPLHHQSQSSFSSQRNKLTESRERDRLINTANTTGKGSSSSSLLVNAGALVLGPPSSSQSPSRTISRSNSAAMTTRHSGSQLKLSAMFEAEEDDAEGGGGADNDHMSAITEATDELGSDLGDGLESNLISAEEVFKSLRRCWKKPIKPYLPTMDSFASLYTQQQQLNAEEDAARRALTRSQEVHSLSSSSGYSLSTGLSSKSTPNFFKEDKDFLAYQLAKQQEEKEKRKKDHKRLKREQEQQTLLLQKKGKEQEDVIGDKEKDKEKEKAKKSSNKNKGFSDLFAMDGESAGNGDGIGDDDEPFFRADLVTEQQKQIEANKIIREQSHESRRAKKKKIYGTGKSTTVIPWNLLDDVEGAKKRLESEIAHIEYNHRF
jgi:hypothetical protein